MNKMTKWEAGQELILCADTLSDAERELRGSGHPDLADLLKECRLKIGTAFNRLGSHEFGLQDESHKNPKEAGHFPEEKA